MQKSSLLILFAGLLSFAGCTTTVHEKDPSQESNTLSTYNKEELAATTSPGTEVSIKTAPENSPNFYLLVGDWIRSDGGYRVSIQTISADGTMKVEYFNPNPIKVGKAKWEMEDDSLYLQVELQDINYPGSTYTLQYLPDEDKLAGIYFQAVEGATYEVLFNRKR